MPLVYFDASAFVKLLTTETGSSLASALWDGCDAALSSRLAYPEVRAALAAAARNHDLTESELADAERDWEDFWPPPAQSNSPRRLNSTPATSPEHMPYAEPTPFIWPAHWQSATPAW
ncbi:ribonuclease VapC45 [Mycobacterium tuberculosis]|nr:ribonuclease VapC45 [Mycobacterium tuberculosis]